MPDLNRRLSGLESDALPTELISHLSACVLSHNMMLRCRNKKDTLLHLYKQQATQASQQSKHKAQASTTKERHGNRWQGQATSKKPK